MVTRSQAKRGASAADSPTSVLEDEEKCEVKAEEEVVADVENGDSPLISKAMEEEEEKLMEARVKEEEAELEKQKQAATQLNETQYTKLDELLTQTQIFTEFLLENMDDITLNQTKQEDETVEKKKGRGSKRKAATQYNSGKARRAVAAMLTRSKEAEGTDDKNLTEDEKVEKEQRELVPLLTGGKLKSYQLKGVKWLISLWQNGLNGILADQMGLGKTIQTIGFIAHLKGKGLDGPYLIIAPLSTLSNWVNEISRFTPSMDAIIYHGDKFQRNKIRQKFMPRSIGEKFPIVVTSYEIALSDAKKHLRHYSWKYVVVDEGHRLKNSKCKLVKELKFLTAENKLLLTGTPLQNNLAELWSLLNFILPDIFQSNEEFESWSIVAKLHAILRPFILRRMKADVELMLPRLGFKGRLNNLVIQLRKNCNHPDLLESAFSGEYFYPPVEQIVEQCGKFRLLERLLIKLFERKHKVLIFTQWTKILDIMDYYFSEKGFEVCRIDGAVKLEERRRQIQEFNDVNSPYRIFLLSTRAGGLGINLTAADTCILYDSDWNPQMDLQAMDRCHRIGQTKPVHVYRLSTAQSVECRMLKRAFSKLKLEHVVIGKGQFHQERTKSSSSALEEEDIVALLREEESAEDKLVQTDISDEDLERILDRSDLVVGSDQNENNVGGAFPLKGPGWEVIIPTASSGMLSTLNS
ncbi:ATP-dependent DNA helicase ddm1 [Turnera subulata]|uniref:ATP-dependent DNA helicase ddm1 n=1 Tax=Turnera subulata TaxID=218843 RepID=A0A9Q0G7G4_9ROSI|nr:ATP-dependent DNA helicase ddm1 [Turnera subulata]